MFMSVVFMQITRCCDEDLERLRSFLTFAFLFFFFFSMLWSEDEDEVDDGDEEEGSP